jgi:AhpD family alkylhydroperoxidase
LIARAAASIWRALPAQAGGQPSWNARPLDWEASRHATWIRIFSMSASDELKKLAPLGETKPDVMKAFVAFDTAVMADGALPKKTKELIAVAVALTTQCQYCLAIHTDMAKKAGATTEELAEASFVAAALRAGAAITHSANHVVDGK